MHRHFAPATSFTVTISLLCCQLAGCNRGNDPPLPQVTTPDENTAQHEISSINALVRESTNGPNFATAQYIDASSAGLIGDGKTDNTAALAALLGSGNRTIHIPAGDYLTGQFSVPSNTALLLDPGVIFRNAATSGAALITIDTTDVYISGYGAKITGDRGAYPPDEQRYGMLIIGASSVVIDGLESSDNAGDGFYIGEYKGQPSQNIVLDDCMASNNRRQGLSIVSARNVYVVNCQFQSTQGAAPGFGIDLEPDYPTQFLDNVEILQPFTQENHGGGIAIYLKNLNANSYPIAIEILDHLSESESPSLATTGSSYVPGTIQYTVATGAAAGGS